MTGTIVDVAMVPEIAINPGTSVETVIEMLTIVDKVLLMTVNHGNSGQMFLPYVGNKIEKILALKDEFGFEVYWNSARGMDKIQKVRTKRD